MTDNGADFWRLLVRRRVAILIACAAVAFLWMPGLVSLQTDNSPEVFFVSGSEEWQAHRAFRQSFGNDQVLRLAVHGDALWTPDGLRWLEATERRISAIPGVSRAAGLPEHHSRFDWPPDDIESFRLNSLANPLDRAAGWIDLEGSLVTTLIQLEELPSAQVAPLLEQIRQAAGTPPEGVELRLVGLPVLNVELDRSSREIEQRFFPLLLLLSVILLGAAVRGVRQLLAALLFVGFCQLATLGTMAYAGVALNMVLAVLPPIIFVIALATALHLVLRVRHVAAEGASEDSAEVPTDDGWLRASIQVFRDKGWSVFWTGITTMTGFASLAISPLAPVRSLGIWAALGLGATTLAAFSLLPALITTLGRPKSAVHEARFERAAASRGAVWGRWAARNRRTVLPVTLMLSILAVFGLSRLHIESNALRYLAEDHSLRQGIELLESRGIGVAAVELLITSPSSGGGAPAPFVSALEVDRLADLASDVQQLDGVHGVVNAGIVLRDALKYVPSTPMNAHLRPQMALDGMAQDVQGREVLASLLAEDRQTARSTIFVTTAGATELEELEEQVLAVAAGRFPEATATITGEYRLLLGAQRHLISTLILSLGLTLLAVAIVLRFLLPSTRLALLALVPNLWPVLGGLGLMGWAGLPLDIATVMMASVVLGLAVDDTIHTLGHFRRFAPADGARVAVEKTLYATTPAYLLTGVILMAGFGVCGLSDFAPISRFGLLSAFSIGLAVIGDLFLLPALLSLTPEEVCRRLGK